MSEQRHTWAPTAGVPTHGLSRGGEGGGRPWSECTTHPLGHEHHSLSSGDKAVELPILLVQHFPGPSLARGLQPDDHTLGGWRRRSRVSRAPGRPPAIPAAWPQRGPQRSPRLPSPAPGSQKPRAGLFLFPPPPSCQRPGPQHTQICPRKPHMAAHSCPQPSWTLSLVLCPGSRPVLPGESPGRPGHREPRTRPRTAPASGERGCAGPEPAGPRLRRCHSPHGPHRLSRPREGTGVKAQSPSSREDRGRVPGQPHRAGAAAPGSPCPGPAPPAPAPPGGTPWRRHTDT